MEIKTYKAYCVNEECGHVMNKSWNFIPLYVQNEKCPRCDSQYEVREYEDDSKPSSASLVSGVGEINSRLPSDWRDFMHKIKKNTKGNNMKDYK